MPLRIHGGAGRVSSCAEADEWGELPLEGQFFLQFVIVVAERIGFAAHPLALALFSDELSLLGHELSPEEDLVRPTLDGESLEGAVVYAVKARGVGDRPLEIGVEDHYVRIGPDGDLPFSGIEPRHLGRRGAGDVDEPLARDLPLQDACTLSMLNRSFRNCLLKLTR